jgi:hypothetical protein
MLVEVGIKIPFIAPFAGIVLGPVLRISLGNNICG